MEREEAKEILLTVCAIYPNFKVQDKTATINAWHLVLADYDYNEIMQAVKSFAQSSNGGFAPSVSQLIGELEKPKELMRLTEGEAWAIVRKSIGRAIYYSVDEFNSFPKEIQEAVGAPEQLRAWAMSEDYNESVIASNFQRAYRSAVERQKQIERLPEEARLKLAGLQRLAIGGGGIE